MARCFEGMLSSQLRLALWLLIVRPIASDKSAGKESSQPGTGGLGEGILFIWEGHTARLGADTVTPQMQIILRGDSFRKQVMEVPECPRGSSRRNTSLL